MGREGMAQHVRMHVLRQPEARAQCAKRVTHRRGAMRAAARPDEQRRLARVRERARAREPGFERRARLAAHRHGARLRALAGDRHLACRRMPSPSPRSRPPARRAAGPRNRTARTSPCRAPSSGGSPASRSSSAAPCRARAPWAAPSGSSARAGRRRDCAAKPWWLASQPKKPRQPRACARCARPDRPRACSAPTKRRIWCGVELGRRDVLG